MLKENSEEYFGLFNAPMLLKYDDSKGPDVFTIRLWAYTKNNGWHKVEPGSMTYHVFFSDKLNNYVEISKEEAFLEIL